MLYCRTFENYLYDVADDLSVGRHRQEERQLVVIDANEARCKDAVIPRHQRQKNRIHVCVAKTNYREMKLLS